MQELSYSYKYLKDSLQLKNIDFEGIQFVGWESPSNIALVKYWGKYGDQLPQNPSVSFNLKYSKTLTKIIYQKTKSSKPKVKYFFEDKVNIGIEQKVKKYLETITVYQPFLKKLDLEIYSYNTFPHSAGLASSASSYSALAHSLCSIENDLFKTLPDDLFYQKASFLARLGSGSASRSIPGKCILWGETDIFNESSNEIAVSMDSQIHQDFKSYYDAILIIDSDKKTVSSTSGHALMNDHPFAKSRYLQANENVNMLINVFKNGNQKVFNEIVENEAMTLHALMLSSNPPIYNLKPKTLEVISKLIEFRKKNELSFTYTLDAGPNIHILYPKEIRSQIVDFIEKELLVFCENEKWIDDKIGDGPKELNLREDVF